MAAPGQDVSLEALLGGMGGGPPGPGGPPPAGPPPGPPPAGPETGGEDVVDIVRRMLDDAQAYLQASTDEEDNQQMSKLIPALQALLAKDQQDLEKASQGQITPRLQRKMAEGAGAPPPGEMAAALMGGGGGGPPPPPGGPLG